MLNPPCSSPSFFRMGCRLYFRILPLHELATVRFTKNQTTRSAAHEVTQHHWHRAGFRLYWAWVSRVRHVGGRKRLSKEVRALVFRMVAENPTWGAPRIHGELLKLGFDVSERSVSRWIRRAPRNPDLVRRWLAFLGNHRVAIAAMDFFSVPTLTFGVLYCFFVIGHDRRKILHFNVTRNPNALWVVQRLRETSAYKEPHRFLLFDRDAKFGADVVSAVRDNGKRANAHGLSQSVGERCCGALGRKLPTRLAGPRHHPK
jgi:hypothetical protein